MKAIKPDHADGTRESPVDCYDWTEACDAAGERGRPIYCAVDGEVCKVYPSRQIEPTQ